MIKKRIFSIAAAVLINVAVFGQAADDGFLVPLERDLTDAIKENAAPQVADSGTAAQKSSILQGLWIEATSDTGAIIRDIATGEKSGYEIDNTHLLSNANWWFWGDINKLFQLDAEISVWDFDKTLYKANSYAANVPDVTIGDGLQSLASMIFSPIYQWNDNGLGAFNKLALNFTSPFVNVRFGYGNLKGNGMSEFTGIYNVIDRWLDVGKGYTEISNGKKLSRFGNVSVKALAAFSQMRGTYGMYDILDLGFGDSFRLAATFGSSTTADQLFFYNIASTNAASLYFSANPIDSLKFELHGLTSFGSTIDFGLDSSAFAGRASYGTDFFNLKVKASYAGSAVDSVWGSDGQIYDDINADTVTVKADFDINPLEFLSAGLDETLTFNDVSALSDGLVALRTQPFFDLSLETFTNMDITLGGYGVLTVERLAAETTANREIVISMEEAGIEINANDVIPFMKKLTFDWAIKPSYSSWASGNFYTTDILYNSFMLYGDINDRMNVHLGGITRTGSDDATIVPFGIAAGFKINKTALPGHPHFWTHFTYGMNPYGENNYSLYRADNWLNKAPHRTYTLNTLDSDTTSHISFGFIWEF